MWSGHTLGDIQRAGVHWFFPAKVSKPTPEKRCWCGESWQNTDGDAFVFLRKPLASTEIAGY
jgi:hypothetical protein